ncbi:MAG TPA: DUF6186 family protein [Actinomycetota bacterium]|jgi:hypothetical protein|nr:DUF6186 family protein [Actinomycetota bacterium]
MGPYEVIGTVGWVVILGAIAAWEVATLVHHDPRTPTMGDVVRFFLRPTVGRWLLFVVWLWLGWHFFIRTTVGA